jgi:hypothetical protein
VTGRRVWALDSNAEGKPMWLAESGIHSAGGFVGNQTIYAL